MVASDCPWPAALLAFMGVAPCVSCPPSSATTCGSLVANMTCVIPQPNHRLGQGVFVTQGTHARRAQEEVATGSGFESQPSSCKHAQEMTAGKEQRVPLDGPHSAYHAVGPNTDLFRGFPSRTPIAEQLPVMSLDVDFNGAATLISTVIPCQQIAINLCNAPEASEFAGSCRAHQRTGEYLGERQVAQPLPKTAGVALATLGQR